MLGLDPQVLLHHRGVRCVPVLARLFAGPDAVAQVIAPRFFSLPQLDPLRYLAPVRPHAAER
jgi:hypothetical protein